MQKPYNILANNSYLDDFEPTQNKSSIILSKSNIKKSVVHPVDETQLHKFSQEDLSETDNLSAGDDSSEDSSLEDVNHFMKNNQSQLQDMS